MAENNESYSRNLPHYISDKKMRELLESSNIKKLPEKSERKICGYARIAAADMLDSSDESSTSNKKGSQQLIPRRMIRSEIITKTRLTTRDENLHPLVLPMDQEEDDDIFIENLKKRMNSDLQQNKIDKRVPRTSRMLKKRKSAFDVESLNLMKKFRAEVREKTDKASVEDNGIFLMASEDNSENQENVLERQTSKIGSNIVIENKIMAPIKIASNIVIENKIMAPVKMNSTIDMNSICLTPQLFNDGKYDECNSTPSIPRTQSLSKFNLSDYL